MTAAGALRENPVVQKFYKQPSRPVCRCNGFRGWRPGHSGDSAGARARRGHKFSPNPDKHRAHRLAASIVFQTTMPVLGDNPVYLTRMIKAASGGVIDLQIFEPGEIVPAFSITDAVRDGKVSAGYTWLGYDQGKIPASPLVSAVPFGMEPWEYTAWWYEGDGAN